MNVEKATPAPLYRLIEDEAGHKDEVLTAVDLDGFFREESALAPPHVWMFGTSLPLDLVPRRFDYVALQVLDLHGNVIGCYRFADARALRIQRSTWADLTDVEMSFRGFFCPFPYAGELWRRWAAGPPGRQGEWTKLPSQWHLSWLHVAQTAWFQAGRLATRYEPKPICTIDGSDIANIASLYCALGEAVNGPGGYFGSSLAGLADCLATAVADQGPFELVWRNRDASERAVGSQDVETIIALFKEFGVRVQT